MLSELKYVPNFITPEEETILLQHIQQLQWQEVALYGQVAKRRVVHYGFEYQYGSRGVRKTNPPPEFLNNVIARCSCLLMSNSADIAEILITEYPVNAGINWHRDAPVFKEIIGISLNSSCVIHFRNRMNKKEKIKRNLERCSAYRLSGAIRWEWEHRIAPVKVPRYSITLRTLC